jgi:hypothetical protein
VTCRVDKVQTTVNAGVLDISVALGRELFAEVGTVLVFNVFDDWVPASFVVDLVTVPRGIDNVEP